MNYICIVKLNKKKMEGFEDYTVDRFNKRFDAQLTEDMLFQEVYEHLDEKEISYFYISLDTDDVLEAIKEEQEVADQLDLELVHLLPQGVAVAIYT